MNKRILTVGFNGTALKNQHPKWTFASIPLPVKEHFIHWDFAFIFGPEFLTVDCKNKKRTDFTSSWNDGFFFSEVKQHTQTEADTGCRLFNNGELIRKPLQTNTVYILYSSVKYGKDPMETLKWHSPNQVLSYVSARQGVAIIYSRNTFKTVTGKKVGSKTNL